MDFENLLHVLDSFPENACSSKIILNFRGFRIF